MAVIGRGVFLTPYLMAVKFKRPFLSGGHQKYAPVIGRVN
jgi:hypothetical protein